MVFTVKAVFPLTDSRTPVSSRADERRIMETHLCMSVLNKYAWAGWVFVVNNSSSGFRMKSPDDYKYKSGSVRHSTAQSGNTTM